MLAGNEVVVVAVAVVVVAGAEEVVEAGDADGAGGD